MQASGSLTTAVWIIAVSTALTALFAVGLMVGVALLLLGLRRALARAEQEGIPTLQAARGVVEDLRSLSGVIKGEAQDAVALSRELRQRVSHAAELLEGRLDDVDSLFEVVYDEVEETALDLAAGLRTVRRGRSVLGRMRRALFGRR